MKVLQILLVVLLLLALIGISGGLTAYALNNKRYSCNSGNCKKDPLGDFASKSACQTYCKPAPPVSHCKPNFDPNCQGKDENGCKKLKNTLFCKWDDLSQGDKCVETQMGKTMSDMSSTGCPYISDETDCNNTANMCVWKTQ